MLGDSALCVRGVPLAVWTSIIGAVCWRVSGFIDVGSYMVAIRPLITRRISRRSRETKIIAGSESDSENQQQYRRGDKHASLSRWTSTCAAIAAAVATVGVKLSCSVSCWYYLI